MAPLVVDPCGYLKPHHSVGHCLRNRERRHRPGVVGNNFSAVERCDNVDLRGTGRRGQAGVTARSARAPPELCAPRAARFDVSSLVMAPQLLGHWIRTAVVRPKAMRWVIRA